MCSMSYYQEKSLIAIVGGRNDELSNIVLDDIWVIRLDELQYQRVLVQSEIGIAPRYNHTATMFGSKLVIFGGLGESMTFQMDIETIEFDTDKVQKKVKKIQKDKERKKKQDMYTHF